MTTGVCFHPNSLEIPAPASSGSFPFSSSDQNIDVFNWSTSMSSCGRSVKSARRNLFGKVNKAEAESFARKEVEKIKEKDKQKYNFDFDNEKPLPGRYKWTKILSSSGGDDRVSAGVGIAVPEAYDLSNPRFLTADAREGETTTLAPSPTTSSPSWSTSHQNLNPDHTSSQSPQATQPNPTSVSRQRHSERVRTSTLSKATIQSPVIPVMNRGKSQPFKQFAAPKKRTTVSSTSAPANKKRAL